MRVVGILVGDKDVVLLVEKAVGSAVGSRVGEPVALIVATRAVGSLLGRTVGFFVGRSIESSICGGWVCRNCRKTCRTWVG